MTFKITAHDGNMVSDGLGRTRRPAWRFPVCALLGLALLLAVGRPAAAQEQLLFPAVDNAHAAILQKIRNENVRLDIAVWYLTDREISVALLNRFNAGVPVRLIGDRVAIFEIDPNTRREFEFLAGHGVPIRLRYHPTWFPEIMHWKCGIFVGQNSVEFGSANWTGFELAPWSSTNFKDETVLFTDDSAIVNAFLTKFDQMWANTSEFLDWPQVYQAETGSTWPTPMNINRARLEPDYPSPPGMIWSQGPELNNAMAAEIDRESSRIEMVVYRLSDAVISDAVIRRRQAGVPVRIFVEPEQYRQSSWPEYWLTGARIDQMWVAGAQVKVRTHQGLTHMKTLITSRIALNGSSNFTRFWQRDHNYFIPAQSKPNLHQAMRNRFDAMWSDTSNYRDFIPLPPQTPALAAPANGASGVSRRPRLEWNRAPWAVAFDVYLGTSPSALVFQGRVNAQLVEDPPQTYSWTPSQDLPAGTTLHWRVVARTFATAVNPSLIATSATRSFTTSGSAGGPGPGVSTPFGGTPVALPGTIQAENFDEGGQNVAYFDTTPGNSGGVYRSTDVDVEATADTGGGYNVGWLAVGEWMKYTVNVTAAGTYTIEARVAAARPGGTFHIEVNGVDRTGPMTIPDTGGWQTWTTISKTGVALSAGQQVWRLVIDSMPSGGVVGNINSLRVVSAGSTPPPPPPPPPGSTPFTGTPIALPGTIQAENFDNGGQNVAYFDLTPGNTGGVYRVTDVDIAAASDAGGGYTLGWVGAGEWLNYTVNVGSAGTYDIETRVASAGAGGTFRIEVNGVDRTGPITVPNTGGWQTWTTIRTTGVSLSAGQQVWRVVMLTNGATNAVGNFNWFRVVAGGSTPPPSAPQIVIYANDVPVGNLSGNWSRASDATAAAGITLASADLGFAAANNPLASPAHYFDVTFNAQAGVRYRLWLRLKAAANDKFNDSVWVQFSGSVGSTGTPIYRIGTTSGLNVNLATCADCPLSGWGWQNRAYWLADTGEVRFATTGAQTIRVQTREDGVEIDQIVLSPSQYVDAAPGPVTNDSTIVPKP